MRPAPLLVVAAVLGDAVWAHAADLYFPSIPEDPYAFPKYRVSFLNGFALPNSTAQRWLADGLAGGEQEFLSKIPSASSAPARSIDSAVSVSDDVAIPAPAAVRPCLFACSFFLLC